MDISKMADMMVAMVGDDQVEALGETIGKAIKSGVDSLVANTETNIDDTKGVALLNGIAKGILAKEA